MKHLYTNFKKTLIPMLFLLFCANATAQMQNLATIAEGDLEFSTLLYDTNGDILGYIYFFNQGEISNYNYQYEYVYLDKNLNKVANGKFIEQRASSVSTTFSNCTAMGSDQILLTKLYKGAAIMNKTVVPVYVNRTISLKESTVSEPFNYVDGEIKDFDIDPKKLRSVYKKNKAYSLIQGFNIKDKSHYIVFEFGKEKEYEFENGFMRIYKLDRSLLWEYKYNETGTKKDWSDISILRTTDESIILMESKYSKEQTISKKIVVLDLETGKKRFEYAVEDQKSKFNHTSKVEYYNGNYYIVGNYSAYDKNTQFNWEKNLGVYQVVLDDKGKELRRKYNPWSKIKGKTGIDHVGKFKDGYQLITKNLFIFKDGRFSLLAEKYKKDKIVVVYHVLAKAQDFLLFNFDAEGNFVENHVIEKDKSRYILNNYLFSQYINNRNGVVFFFKNNKKDDETGEKSWMLGINTLVDGKFNQESIPMSSDEFSIAPIPAKEGYILLREYNKDEKYNQIRLEKLNY